MIKEVVYSPHYDFFIDKAHRESGYEMSSFHIHKKYELYYQVDGSRKYFIGDAVYMVGPGDVVIIDQDDAHKTGSTNNSPHTRIVLNFNHDYLDRLSGLAHPSELLAIFSLGVRVLALSPKQKVLISSLMERLLELTQENEPDTDTLRVLLLSELLIDLRRYAQERLNANYESPKLYNKTIDKIAKYISENYMQNLTLGQIAAQFYISPYHLSRLFKKTMDISIVEYINSVRVRAAMHLLDTTSLKVTDIAEKTGFQTSSHFSRVFKTSTGLSPNRYRKYYRNNQA